MPGLMAEEEHRPQGSDAATGDGKPDEAVLRDAPASLAGLPFVHTYRRKVTRLMPTKYMIRIDTVFL